MSMTDQKVRWGIIGCGQIAYDRVMPGLALAENCALVALFDPDQERLQRASAAAPEARVCRSMDDLLADTSVEAVYIATPNSMHASQTVAAAEAGKHILVEKPMALNADEGMRMVAAAERAGVKLMVAYMTLFNPAYRMAKRIVEAGMLGEIVAVRGRHSYPIAPDRISAAAAWRLDAQHGGGPLMDVGVYPTFTLRDLTGLRATELTATGAVRRLRGKTEYDSILWTFLLEDGTPGAIEANFTFTSSTIELEGTRGRLSLQGHISQLVQGRLEVELWLTSARSVSERISHVIQPEALPPFYNYFAEVEHFADCIRQNKEVEASGKRAISDLQVTDAVRDSLRTGRRVELARR